MSVCFLSPKHESHLSCDKSSVTQNKGRHLPGREWRGSRALQRSTVSLSRFVAKLGAGPTLVTPNLGIHMTLLKFLVWNTLQKFSKIMVVKLLQNFASFLTGIVQS